jgi:hypothetical protein
MGHSKSKEITRSWLESVPLPSHGKSYTVVSHKEVIDGAIVCLKKNGFNIDRALYKANMNARVAQGIYHLSHTSAPTDPEMGMMFAWTNSYDKSTRFQCGIGAHVFVCNNGLIHGDLATYGRKHTGTANADIAGHVSSQIGMANHKFTQLVNDKNKMKTISLPIRDQAELLGRLFADEKLLDSQQIGIVRSEMEGASYNYGLKDYLNAWAFYNHVTHAFKKTHPRNWMDNQSKFHKFMSSEILSAHTPQPQDQSSIVDINDDGVIEAEDLQSIDEFTFDL